MGTRVGTRGENGIKMWNLSAVFGNSFPLSINEKCPKCVKNKHLGHFTMAEKEGFDPLKNVKIDVDTCSIFSRVHFV